MRENATERMENAAGWMGNAAGRIENAGKPMEGCLPIEKNRKLCYNRTGSEGREEFPGAQCGTERTDLD